MGSDIYIGIVAVEEGKQDRGAGGVEVGNDSGGFVGDNAQVDARDGVERWSGGACKEDDVVDVGGQEFLDEIACDIPCASNGDCRLGGVHGEYLREIGTARGILLIVDLVI